MIVFYICFFLFYDREIASLCFSLVAFGVGVLIGDGVFLEG